MNNEEKGPQVGGRRQCAGETESTLTQIFNVWRRKKILHSSYITICTVVSVAGQGSTKHYIQHIDSFCVQISLNLFFVIERNCFFLANIFDGCVLHPFFSFGQPQCGVCVQINCNYLIQFTCMHNVFVYDSSRACSIFRKQFP